MAPGAWIEQDLLGIIEKVQNYDPNLRVQFLDPSRSDSPGDAPYRIVELCPDGLPRVVFSVWELNDLVLERLYAADTQKQDILANLSRHNDNVRARAQRRYDDVMGEAKELVEDILRSPKSTYTVRDPFTGEIKKFE